jgi:hypothetical protein
MGEGKGSPYMDRHRPNKRPWPSLAEIERARSDSVVLRSEKVNLTDGLHVMAACGLEREVRLPSGPRVAVSGDEGGTSGRLGNREWADMLGFQPR